MMGLERGDKFLPTAIWYDFSIILSCYFSLILVDPALTLAQRLAKLQAEDAGQNPAQGMRISWQT